MKKNNGDDVLELVISALYKVVHAVDRLAQHGERLNAGQYRDMEALTDDVIVAINELERRSVGAETPPRGNYGDGPKFSPTERAQLD